MRARAWSSALAALACSLLFSTAVAPALQLARLHVTSFTLGADVSRVRLEEPFHLIVSLHVTENVPRIDNLDLPDFFGVEELGDERHISSGPAGTDYREVLTLVAHQSGRIHFTPATLAAIDARDGKPKRFLSNDLTLQVVGGVAQVSHAIGNALATLLRVILVLLALGVVALIFVRRRSAAPVPPPAPIARPDPPPVASPGARAGDALAVLRAERGRPEALALRRELWAIVGAREGETLADALRHPGAADAATRAVLRAAERAAFINDAHLQTAIDDLIEVTERFLE
ncbi:MAG: hypothetical protein ACXWNM_13000 [Vulcanimicrobiaceae bacterium]